jgi:signal transduction histidine kinase
MKPCDGLWVRHACGGAWYLRRRRGGVSAGAPAQAPADAHADFWRLADDCPVGLLRVHDGCVAEANAALRALAGRGDALLGLKLDDLLEDTGRGLPREGGPAAVECALRRPDGSRRTLACRRAVSRLGPGSCWWVEDVSSRRDLESELLRAGRELAAANREREGVRSELAGERGEREELLTMVSHELRTPLTVVAGYARLLLAEEVGPLAPEQRRFLEETLRACTRLDRFVANLMEASRIQKGAPVLELGRERVDQALESVSEMFRPLLLDRGLGVQLRVDPGAVWARCDRVRVEQVLTNLLGNAIRYARRGGRIEIASRALPAEPGGSRLLEVSVADDGPGVAPADRVRIFEPYVQADGPGRAGGLGLGLAICRRLVEAHGGTIGVRERPGGGACFFFTLPAAEELR